jgi:hypothetical protein
VKPRRVIITIEAETDLSLAGLRNICGVIVREGRYCQRVVSDNRFVASQVQVNAIQPVRESYKLTKANRAKGAK